MVDSKTSPSSNEGSCVLLFIAYNALNEGAPVVYQNPIDNPLPVEDPPPPPLGAALNVPAGGHERPADNGLEMNILPDHPAVLGADNE